MKSRHWTNRGHLAALVLILGLVASGCGDGKGSAEDDVTDITDTMDVADTGDTTPDATPDVTPDLPPPDLIPTDMPQPRSCPAGCTEYGDLAAMCIFGGMSTRGRSPFEPPAAETRYAKRSSAYYVPGLTRGMISELRRELPVGARVDLSSTHEVIIVDKVDVDVARETVRRVTRVERELPTLIKGSERIVALPQIVLMASPDASRDAIQAIAASEGWTVHKQLALPGAWVLTSTSEDDAFLAAEAMATKPGVENAEVNFLRSYRKNNDPQYPDQWHLDNTGQNSALPGADILAEEAWGLTTGDASVIIAIHDDGVDVDHPEFAGRILYADGARSTEAFIRAELANGVGTHGTAVAGVAAAAANNMAGGRGVCPDCSVMPLLILEGSFAGSLMIDDATVSDDVAAAVAGGAAVINASWGPAGGDPAIIDEPLTGPGTLSPVVSGAFDFAETMGRGGLGTVIVYAAGNENQDNVGNPYVGHPTTVTVAAYDDQGLKSGYSDFGASIDVAAPSSGGITTGIIAPLPQLGSGPVFQQISAGGFDGPSGEPYTRSFGGTSSAAPVVTGVVGLMVAANPAITAAQIRQILRDTAIPIDRLNGQYDQNGHSIYYGHGGVNAYAAVLAAQDLAGTCDAMAVEACNGVDDNCDGTIDEGCATVADCTPCEFDSACDSGVCARTPNDIGGRCVTACVAGSCGAGFDCVGGYCVPETTGRCDACEATDTCNGIDDNCDGAVDESGCPAAGTSCYYDASCGAGATCNAVNGCSATCDTADDCNELEKCEVSADRYGNAGEGICYIDQVAQLCIGFLCNQQPQNAEDFFICLDSNNNPDCGDVFGCALAHLDLSGLMP